MALCRGSEWHMGEGPSLTRTIPVMKENGKEPFEGEGKSFRERGKADGREKLKGTPDSESYGARSG
jgi:hypothetical protein